LAKSTKKDTALSTAEHLAKSTKKQQVHFAADCIKILVLAAQIASSQD